MEHPDEGTIHAWLDDALSVQESAVITAHVAACAECAASVAEARGFIAATTRIVSALDDVPRGVLPQREVMTAAPPRARIGADDARSAIRPWWARPQLAAAALLVVVAGSVYSVRDRDASMRDTVYENPDSARSRPALVPSPAASQAPAPEAVSTRSSTRVAQQSTAATDAASIAAGASSASGAASASPRALSERADARRETRKLETSMSAPVSAPAAASHVAPPPAVPPALADAAPAPQLRKAPENDAIAPGAQSQGAASAVAAARRTTGAVTGSAAAAQSFARAIPITPGCYATGAPGMPPRIVLTDSIVATVSARAWFRARPWPVSAQNSAAEWRWSALETTAAELLAIIRGDTTSYRVSTASRDVLGCR